MKKLFFFVFFLLVSLFSGLSLAGTDLSEEKARQIERAEQMCYIKNRYILKSVYDYRYPYFYRNKKFTNDVPPIFLLRRINISKNPWELKGLQSNFLPLSKKNSLTHWFQYNFDVNENRLSKLCKMKNNFCFFRVVYEGDLFPVIEKTGKKSLTFQFKNKVRVSIYDSQNNLLKFPKSCPNNYIKNV